tara:strand:- start:385 stop:582 length:198 start_codon:yes stop_codon:yes gene_type:complete
MKTAKELVSELRDSGATQKLIAQQAGVSQPTVSRWASGTTPDMSSRAYNKLTQMLNPVATHVDHN